MFLKRTQMVKIEHQISVTVRVYGPLKRYLPLLKQKKNVFLINVYFQKYNFSSKQCCCGYKCTRLLLFGLFHVHTFLVYSGSCQTNSWSGSTLLPLLFLPTFWKDFVQFSFFLFFLLKTGKPRSRECCLSGEQCRHMHPLWCITDFHELLVPVSKTLNQLHYTVI